MNDNNLKSSALFTPSCCLTADALMQFVSGTLEKAERIKAEQHIAECPLCADAADGLRMWQSDTKDGQSLNKLYERTKVINDRLKQHLHTHASIEGSKNQRLSDRPSVWFAAAAAIILLMGISYIFWIQNQYNTRLQGQKQQKEREANLLAQMPENLAYPPANSNVILDIKYNSDKKSNIPPVVSIVFEDVAMAPERVSHGGPNAGKINDEAEYTETRDGVESDVLVDEPGMYKGKNANRTLPVKNSGGAMKKPEADEETTSVFISVQQMPSFPGGDAARLKYLAKNLRYPARAAEEDIQGTVYISFVVKTDGKITNVKLLHGIGGGCDEEALRVVSKMPQWKPGFLNGKKVDVRYNMPVHFKLR
jgi:TonB family protein